MILQSQTDRQLITVYQPPPHTLPLVSPHSPLYFSARDESDTLRHTRDSLVSVTSWRKRSRQWPAMPVREQAMTPVSGWPRGACLVASYCVVGMSQSVPSLRPTRDSLVSVASWRKSSRWWPALPARIAGDDIRQRQAGACRVAS